MSFFDVVPSYWRREKQQSLMLFSSIFRKKNIKVLWLNKIAVILPTVEKTIFDLLN